MTAELVSTTIQQPEVAVPEALRRLPPVPWRDPHSVPPELLEKYIRDLEAACAADPQAAGPRTCLGMAYAMNYQIYKSMDALEKAIAAEPDHFYAQIKYAELHFRLRALIKAEVETVRALELAQSPFEFTLARKQLQEIRTLMRHGTQRPEWTKSLRVPAIVVAALLLMAFMVVHTR